MAHWLNDTLLQVHAGERLDDGATSRRSVDCSASAAFAGSLWTCAERWRAAMQKIEAPVTLADIFRTRVTFS